MYKIVFNLFDRDGSGEIDANDMATIAFKLGRDPDDRKSHSSLY